MSKTSHAAVTKLARRPRNPKRALSKVQALRSQLADCLIEEDLAEAVEVLRDTLHATKHQAVTKHSAIEVPDHTSRMAAAKLILEYAVGRPSTIEDLPPEDTDESSPVANEQARDVVQRLRRSGLNLLEIVDAYDATGDTAPVVEADVVDQQKEDERVAKAFGG